MSPIEFDQNHLWHPYAKIPGEYPNFWVEAADGVELILQDGRRVIDGMSAWWAAIFGYNHPVLNSALSAQAQKMAHVMFGGLTHEPAVRLGKTLDAMTPRPLNKIFFADSGSVAVEVALKIALQFWQNQKRKNKQKFVTIYGGYHGDTFGAMSVCDPKTGMHHLFQKMLPQQFFAKQPTRTNTEDALQNLDEILQKHHNEIAAMILEPIVQGAGGMNIYHPDYLIGARNLCDRYQILLIIDEIATGFGRTGRLFASDYARVVADILCLGKALTGGYMTLGATLTNEKIAHSTGILMHGPTFMASPLACHLAATNVNLLLKSNWRENVATIEAILKNELSPLKNTENVVDVRVIGAIGVAEMRRPLDIRRVQNFLVRRGIWLRPYGKLLYTMPPFIIDEKSLKKITDAMRLGILTNFEIQK